MYVCMDVLIVVIVNDIANVTHHIMNSITALIYIFTSMYSVYKCLYVYNALQFKNKIAISCNR